MNLSKKALSMTASVTLAITAKAKKLKEEGVDVVSFGAGEPDFNTPVNIQKAAEKAIEEGKTKYTPASGIQELKEAICNKLSMDNGLTYKPSQIVVSNGAKHSLYNTLMAILNPGDEVLVPNPYWVSYPELVKLNDGIPVFVPTTEENEFKYTIDELEAAVTDKTKAIILNSPNNPTGTVYTSEELKVIGDFAVKHDMYIISDEIYEKLVYGDTVHVSIASLSDTYKERTIVINGMSKAYAMTGWRMGYTASSEEIAKVMSNVQSHATSNPSSITQYASVEALTGSQSDIILMKNEFEKRRNYMVEKINSIKGISCKMPQGAFYVMINITEVIGKKIKGYSINSSEDLCKALLEEEKVAVIPGEAFGTDKYVRLSYATSLENIIKGLDRIEKFLS